MYYERYISQNLNCFLQITKHRFEHVNIQVRCSGEIDHFPTNREIYGEKKKGRKLKREKILCV